MKWYAQALIRWRWWVLGGLLVITGLALYGMTFLRVDPSTARLLPRQGSAAETYQHFLRTFGSDEEILIALHDPQRSILSPEGLTAIRRLTQALSDLPGVSTVHSLTQARDMRQLQLTPFGIAVPRLLPDEPLSPLQVEALRHNMLMRGTLLSADLHTAGLLVVPEVREMSSSTRDTWLTAVRAVAAQHARDGRQTYTAGIPLERHDVTAYIQRDQRRILPCVLLILLGVTYAIYRVKRFALLSLTCVLLALIWVLGVVGWSGVPLNVITALLPAVILVVSVSVVVHLVNQFLDEADGTPDVQVAVERAIGHVGVACLLTSVTNALGFFSLPVIQAPAVQEFGLFAGLGVLCAFVVTMTYAPVMLLSIGRVPVQRWHHLKTGRLENALESLTHWVARHRRMILLGMLGFLVAMLPGIWQIREGTDIVRALKADAPLRLSSEFIDRHLTGVYSLEILVQAPMAADLTSPGTIRQVLAFAHWLRAQPEVTAVFSPWEPLRGVRAELLEDDAQLQLLATLLPLEMPLTAWMDPQDKMVRLSARIPSLDSARVLALAERVQQQALVQALPLQVTGTAYMLAHMSRALVSNQVSSLACAVVMIVGTITLAFRSWQFGLLAALPNLLPTVLIFGLMGWCGVALSAATAMIASVALGLFVDDTIHLLYLYRAATQAGRAPLSALTYAIRQAGRAVLFTSCILTLGFWAGLLGSFKPTLYFSWLMGCTMLFSVVTELLVTPAAILMWEDTRRDDISGRRYRHSGSDL
ncbi:MAG: hypothetical protein FJZ47_13535 [Candidatus Tectomicrobia bacterium]|uniref:SSD domain-containing protein n=1 Tax=Tectimicrobiota bacterium TaxID=2528274 RepID=A0A937W0Z6_UNCTE|nr:hypothetical protein [Candidatus Tectomicrobia bacterium]